MDLNELLDRIDIVDLISQYVDLEERNGEYWGISPLRNPPENTPSFSVRRETHRFYCFSTGIGGTAITFLKYYYHISGREAIEKLKEYAGIQGEVISPPNKLAATKVCQRFTNPSRQKKQGKQPVLSEDYMERFEVRDDKLAVWESEGISRESLEKFQVSYDAFSDRLVYPIRDMSGNIVNIGGRTLDPNWKEKKLRKYTYFGGWDGGLSVVYGLFDNLSHIKETKEVILFEGCKSVLLADTYGIHNCGAILTSHLSPLQMKTLLKLGCRVVFALDNDVDVTQDHNIQKLKRFVNVEFLHDTEDLLAEKDSPIDKGEEVFNKLYASRNKLR